jgi:hypothetical protein
MTGAVSFFLNCRYPDESDDNNILPMASEKELVGRFMLPIVKDPSSDVDLQIFHCLYRVCSSCDFQSVDKYRHQ